MTQLTQTQKKFLKYPAIFIICILAYYFFFVGFEKGRLLCKNYYCLAFIEFNDFLAILISILGILAVVESLDAWKDQHKFENSIETLRELEEINRLINIFDVQFARLSNPKTPTMTYKDSADLFYTKVKEMEIRKKIKDLDEKIHYEKNHLFQSKFEFLINIAHEYVNTNMTEFTKLKWQGPASPDFKDNDIDYIQKKTRNDRVAFQDGLRKLRSKFYV
ncbi:hypothetical protein ACT4VB_01340 [Acinetobacter baumannii]|nr:hypothetical protein [Acinetobacter baumannii]MDC4849077.1 hypothetical protein [Acinetobacter baumannii]MDC5125228.1 hypothetical protein [Acinetobacter baumannii]